MKSRLPLLMLLLVSAAPVLAAWVLFQMPELMPDGHSNQGQLIQPVVPLVDASVVGADGERFSLGEYQGRWLMLIPRNDCPASCRQRLHDVQQVRLALGMDRSRLERLLLLSPPPAGDTGHALDEAFPGLDVAIRPPGEANAQATDDVVASLENDSLYLVDPLGNLMMRYPPETTAEQLLTDLERLLAVSKSWGNHASN